MSEQSIKLVAGLGNPGPKYDRTRHNAGFWLVDELANRFGGSFKTESRFSGEVCKVRIAGQEVLLLKPTTFMNRSGLAVRQLSQFYKVDLGSILVAHDELDLPPEQIRLKLGGGHGGHNGLRDIFAHLGKDFWRLRIGVGHPGDKSQVVDYVLHAPSSAEFAAISQNISSIADNIDMIVCGDFEKAMSRLHTR